MIFCFIVAWYMWYKICDISKKQPEIIYKCNITFEEYCKEKNGIIIKHEYNWNGCYSYIYSLEDYELPKYWWEEDFNSKQ